MASTAHPSALDSVRPSHDEEALLLAELLRTCRLSLLYAEPGSDKTALIKSVLVPLLSRRAGDQSIAITVRASGVVIPIPDRRSRSVPAARRRREIVVYCGNWTETPLTALRESLYRTAGIDRATRDPSASLSESLERLGRQFDADFVILLDRFEDVLEASPPAAAIEQFVDELAEAVNRANLPANFLIALAEEARPRLVGLRSRIRGFDDFSLKLTPPKHVPDAARWLTHEVSAVEAGPVVTETLAERVSDSIRSRSNEAGSVRAAIGKPKAARTPPPRLQVETEDVYAMIDAALSRIAARTAATSSLEQSPTLPGEIKPQSGGLPAGSFSSSAAATRGKTLQEAIDRMERRLGLAPEDEPSSHC